jgi:ATP-dependent DNA helicase RecG
MNYSAQELFELLNQQDENTWIEAKGGQQSSHSVMETVCAFCNEPGLGGGYILLGVAEDNSTLFPQYKVVPVTDPDKFQRDFATQCAGMFNFPIRPKVTVEKINGHTVIKIWVDELPAKQKPLFFRTDGLPQGAFRRIGSTDQHCTEDDMHIFYQDSSSYDQSPVPDTTIADIDENAMKRYRLLREKVNPAAEELTYGDQELLEALGCVNRKNPNELNIAGLLLFGTSQIQRRTFPMLRVDYIRVPGNSWIQNADNRFTTIDMRGPLLLMLYRLIDAINADLPKGFLLPENDPQAASTGLPVKALREAIVNALMHRSYREHRPTQIIRYDNRIEILNPGYSLKAEDKLGMPGSETRNPFIAAVFHDTNLAETKGSGIRAMRRLMQESHLAPPTFESSRENNEFTSRLLLHHFLGENDIVWLNSLKHIELNDSQKIALLFVREVGAIDNQTYRQMADCDTLKASSDLRLLKNQDLLKSKGKGKATYYITGDKLNTEPPFVSTDAGVFNSEPSDVVENNKITPSTDANIALNTDANALNTDVTDELSTEAKAVNRSELIEELPKNLRETIITLKERESNPEKIKEIIVEICRIRYFRLIEIASLLQKGDNYISRKFIKPMIDANELTYQFPDMIKHPEQAYKTVK